MLGAWYKIKSFKYVNISGVIVIYIAVESNACSKADSLHLRSVAAPRGIEPL